MMAEQGKGIGQMHKDIDRETSRDRTRRDSAKRTALQRKGQRRAKAALVLLAMQWLSELAF